MLPGFRPGHLSVRGPEVFDAKVKAGPGSAAPPLHCPVRNDTVDRFGKVTLRYDSRLHHIGLGARHRGKAIVLFVADRDVPIVTDDGELPRHLVLDPTRDYQPQSIALAGFEVISPCCS
jgi:hypothetical protein